MGCVAVYFSVLSDSCAYMLKQRQRHQAVVAAGLAAGQLCAVASAVL